MEAIFEKKFTITGAYTDRFGRLKPSSILFFVQEAAGEHCDLLHVSWDALQQKNLFWAIIRHKVQISRLPQKGERITVETWPMPTTRTAYPRSVIAYDEQHQELFRSISLWVLMDPNTRALVLPKNSGVEVMGLLRGNELSVPGSLVPGSLSDSRLRQVCFSDLDINGHMNNARYMDWIWDLLPSHFHRSNQPKEFTLNYHAEAREGELLEVKWALSEEGKLKVESFRKDGSADTRIFSALIEY